ncbi:MAG: class C sortase [Microbacteriaceae bacterium]|nr:class C sortase [Cryobacterium sp.]MCC6376834.1 class C sortase [Microbacteriaceae bacterium]
MKSKASSKPKHKVNSRWKVPWLAIATSVVFFVGAVVLLAPSIANWISELDQASELRDLKSVVEDLGAQALAQQLQEAREYNQTLTGGALVAAGERKPLPQSEQKSSKDFDYNSLLRADARGLMARIKIPSISVDLPIYHGTTDDTLEEGVGHLEGTALPVGGLGTRSVLTAHRGLATAVLFTNLDKVKVGDTFTIEVFGEVLVYRVFSSIVVEPNDSKALYPEAGKDLVTLVTCTPLGINSHRILVTGERIVPTPSKEAREKGDPPRIPHFPWWMLILAGTVVLLTIYVWKSGKPQPLKANRKTAHSDGGERRSAIQENKERKPRAKGGKGK